MTVVLPQRRLPMLIILHLNTETLISLLHVSRKINYMIWMNNREASTIPPDFPITISNRLVPSFLPPLSFHCAVKNEMCWWNPTKGAEATWKAKRGKKIFRKEGSTIVGIINRGTRKISARWPQTVFYFCPCQVHRGTRSRTNTSSLTRDTFTRGVLH